MKSLIEKFREYEITSGEIKLTTTQELTKFTEEQQELLSFLYSSRDIGLRCFATVLNAIFTQGRVIFVITRRLMDTLVKKDTNTDRKSVNSKTYQTLISRMITCNFIKQTREPSEYTNDSSKKNKAGLYEVSETQILEVLAKNIADKYFKAQKENAYKWYDQEFSEDTVPEELGKDQILLIESAKRRVYARRK